MNSFDEIGLFLGNHFKCKERKGWLTLESRLGFRNLGFLTNRIARVSQDGTVLFTIGGSKKGAEEDFNQTIRKLIELEELEVIEGRSTSGQKKSGAIGAYLGFQIKATDRSKVLRILLRIEGAAFRTARF